MLAGCGLTGEMARRSIDAVHRQRFYKGLRVSEALSRHGHGSHHLSLPLDAMEIPLERAVPLVELPSLGRVRGPQAPGQMEDRLRPYRLAIMTCVPRCLGSKG